MLNDLMDEKVDIFFACGTHDHPQRCGVME